MSSGLMSCVRENSPPLEMAGSDSGALSLPTVDGSTSPNNASSAEQQKRRRFHPLRNLRRMFRRRTLTSVDLTSPSSSTLDSNQLSASSPSSPLQHQLQPQQQKQEQTQQNKQKHQQQQQHLEQHLTKKTQSSATAVAGSNTLSVPAHGYAGTSSSSTSLPTSPLSLSPTPAALAAGSQTCATNKAISSSHHKTTLHDDPTNHDYYDDDNDDDNQHYRHYLHHQHNTIDNVTTSAMSLSTPVHHQQFATNTTTTSVSSSAIATGRNLIGTCGGIGVLPGAFANTNRTSLLGGYYGNKEKMANAAAAASSYTVGRETKLKSTGTDLTNDLESSREMTDSQRSLSEGRLVDRRKEAVKLLKMVAKALGLDVSILVKSCSFGLLVLSTFGEKITVVSIFQNYRDFSRDGLSQSHDSVFSESATASSLSIVLKAELADVLRKRRNRPDASDEDLGLPRSPTTPQRREITNTTNQSEVSSLSLLSMGSTTDFDDELTSSLANHSGEFSSTAADRTSSSISSRFSADSSRSEDVELFSSNWTRLSHSAAKHKMAVRPSKKKGPTRHRRTLESSVLPSTPEVNEVDNNKTLGVKLEVKDISDKAKSRSLPPGVNAKILEQHSTDTKQTVSIKRSKTEKGPSPNSTYAIRSNVVKSSIFEAVNTHSTPKENKDDENNFFRRFVYRNSKRGASKPSDNIKDEHDSQPEIKKSNSPIETAKIHEKTHEKIQEKTYEKVHEKTTEYSQKVEETRKEIRREIMSEGKSALSAMLNTFILSPESEKMVIQASNENIAVTPANKPKSGPAARQRYIPKDLSQPPPMETDINAKKPRTSMGDMDQEVFNSTTITVPKISKSYTEESFQSTSLIREINAVKEQSPREHFEKKPKIIGLSAFQQKISRSNDSFTNSSSTDSVEMFLGPDYRKRGKSVEKSKSFRTYTDSKEEKDGGSLKSQMPSLPDLSQKKDDYVDDDMHRDLSLGFEINDNNLVKQKPSDLPLTHGIYTKNIILTTSKNIAPRITTKSPLFGASACSKNISEIEDNIDKLVKSPFVSVLRKSATVNDSMASKLAPNVTISPMPSKRIEVLTKVENKIDKILNSDDKEFLPLSPPATPAVPPPTPTTPTMPTIPGKVIMREKTSKSAEYIRMSSPQVTPSPKSNSFSRSRRSSSAIDTTENDKRVPEFMKIQLNRVDPTRTKSNVVLSKNARESNEDLTRRFSNESVEITEVKPPTPTEEDKHIMKRSNSSASSLSDESLPKSPVKKIFDDDNNTLRSTDSNTSTYNSNMSLLERRKLFLSEDKIKADRKVEEMKLERKKSMSEEVRKCPNEEEPVVVIMRKKSFGVVQPSAQNNNNNNNKDDPTPELMKVFARRSLKIKDEDLPDPPNKKFTPSMDSDKENQSSSEEKLDKFPTIQQQQNGGSKSDIDISKNRNSLADFRINKSPSLNNNGIGTPTKTFIPPMRLTGPFRNTTQSSPVNGKTTSLTDSSTNNNNNNSLTNNNNNVSKPIERQSLGPVVLSTSVPPCITLVEHNPTSAVITKTTTIERSATMATMNRVESEFKGIHQRRAEWEKRAKEALK